MAAGPANDNSAAQFARMSAVDGDRDDTVSVDAYAEWLESGGCLSKPAVATRSTASRSAA